MRKSDMETERVPRLPREKKVKPHRARAERSFSGNGFKRSFGDVMHSRITIGLICFAISLLIAFVGVPAVQGYVSQRVPIVRAAADIGRGVQITADMLKVEDVAAIDKPPNAAQSIEQVVGAYAAYDLLQEDSLTSNKLSREKPQQNPYLYELPVGKMAISVSVQGLSEGLSGKLRAGDIVSVYAIFNRSNAEENYTAAQLPELKYMRVLAVTNSAAQDIDMDAGNELVLDNNNADSREKLPATVVLLVGDMQAAALAGINHNATIHMALVARADNAPLCQAFLDEQDAFIAELLKQEDKEETDAIDEPGAQNPEAAEALDAAEQAGNAEEESNG